MDRFLSSLYDLDAPRLVEANRKGVITPEQKMYVGNVFSFFSEFKRRAPWFLLIFFVPWGCIFASIFLLSKDVSQTFVFIFFVAVLAVFLYVLLARLIQFFRWRRITKRELEAGNIQEATGVVSLGRNAFEIKLSDQRLRLPYPERGDLQPGIRYAVYFLPESKTVLSAEPVGPVEERQIRSGLTQILAEANHFSLEALADNRQGRLTPGQIKHLFPDLLISLLMVCVPAGVLFYQWSEWGFSVDLKTLELSTLLIGIALIAIAGFGTYRMISSVADMAGGWVESVEGVGRKRVKVKKDSDGDRNTNYFYRVGGLDFKVKERAYLAFEDGRKYRVFYTPSTRKMVNIEAL